jgi:hypothetical protein
LNEEVKALMVKNEENEQVIVHSVNLNLQKAEVKETLEVLQFYISDPNCENDSLVCLFGFMIISSKLLQKSIGMEKYEFMHFDRANSCIGNFLKNERSSF